MHHSKIHTKIYNLFKGTLFILATAFVFSNLSNASEKAKSGPANSNITPEFEARIVERYSAGHCEQVREMAGLKGSPQRAQKFRPNILAIIAFCEPPETNAEDLFKLAEEKNPTGDLILVLHAKYRYRKDPKSAEELWQKVLMYARNPYLIQMAKDYLSDVIDPKDNDKALSLTQTTYYGSFQSAGTFDTNPKNPIYARTDARSSYGVANQFSFNVQRWKPYGSLAANLGVNHNTYFSAHYFDLIQSTLTLPIALRVGENEDITFQPFGGYTYQGQSSAVSQFGLGVQGIVYRSQMKQFVQASLYHDQYYQPSIQYNAGVHYKFEYSWDYFPAFWFYSFLFSVDHVAADEDPSNQMDGALGLFNNSHTDFGFQGVLKHEFRTFTVGITGKVVIRDDSADSQYNSKISGLPVSKKRRDTQIVFKPQIDIPLISDLQLIAYYEFNRVFSNITVADYSDHNHLDQIVGIGLRAQVSSY